MSEHVDPDVPWQMEGLPDPRIWMLLVLESLVDKFLASKKNKLKSTTAEIASLKSIHHTRAIALSRRQG